MSEELFGLPLRRTNACDQLSQNDLPLSIGHGPIGLGDRHHHSYGGFARILNQIERIACKLPLPAPAAKKPPRIIGRFDQALRRLGRHVQAPEDDADDAQRRDYRNEDVHEALPSKFNPSTAATIAARFLRKLSPATASLSVHATTAPFWRWSAIS